MAVSLLKREDRPVVDLSDLTTKCPIRQCKVSDTDTEKIVHYEGCDYNDPEHCYACQDDWSGSYVMEDDIYSSDRDDDYSMFADPGGRSSLLAENVLRTYDADGVESIVCPEHKCHQVADHTDGYCRKCGYKLNIRNRPCGDCGCENMISDADMQKRYRCDHCADAAEGYSYPRSCSGGY
jgi:hypothetical protein